MYCWSYLQQSQLLYNFYFILLFFYYFFPGIDGLPLPPHPALGVKVLDSWKYEQSNKAARLQATLGVGQINISG